MGEILDWFLTQEMDLYGCQKMLDLIAVRSHGLQTVNYNVHDVEIDLDDATVTIGVVFDLSAEEHLALPDFVAILRDRRDALQTPH